ncbi:MAG: YggT family protein [Brevinema sp.]
MPVIIETISIIFNFLNFAVQIYNFIFLIWIISTWFPVDRSFFLLQFVDMLINPVYNTLLRIFPPLRLGMLDMSPFYMFIFLTFLDYFLIFLKQILLLSLIRIMN